MKIRKEQKLWPLPPRQKEVLEFLKKFITKNGYAPMEHEVASGLDMSLSMAKDSLFKLTAKGHIQRKPKHAIRNIRIVEK